MKICNKCRREKPVNEFGNSSTRKDGRRAVCRECNNAATRRWWAENRKKEPRATVPEFLKIENKKRWNKENAERLRASRRKWEKANPEAKRKNRRLCMAKVRHTPKGRLNHSIGVAVNLSLSRKAKAGISWKILVGYTAEELRRHLEKQFKPGMTWDNYGTWWHVDHKTPIAAFNFQRPGDLDFKRCWALSNLQPLEAAINVKKQDKIDRPFQPCLAL